MMISISRLLCVVATLDFAVAQSYSLPQVDLGYEVHQAYSYNSSTGLYNFTNIRYAQPPLGDLRFAAPVAPTGRNPVVQNGSVGRVCPQAGPIWTLIAAQFVPSVVLGTSASFNYTQALINAQAQLANSAASLADPRTSEDCLFLDVIVPKAIFDGANGMRRKRAGSGAPVVVWIYGGGYTAGSKGGSGDPTGLIRASQADGSSGVVYVAMNYRLGAMGWLAGPTLQASGGVSNAALYDQRLAIEWVAKNIHLFGGDPNQITIIGESAGGGSIMHQVTAFGGQRGVSFQKAIPQSPGWVPTVSQFTQENTTANFLALLNVSTIAEARNLSSAAVIRANAVQVAGSPYGAFTYGPVVDGTFVPALPGLSLLNGAFVKNISLMIGHNTNEGLIFTAPYAQSDTALATQLTTQFPTIQQPVISYILNTLYPANFSGVYPYRTAIERTSLIITESIFTCNTNYLARAFRGQTYNYEFQVPPALHGQDIAYTFANVQPTVPQSAVYAPIAAALQGYITNFAKTGSPNGPGVPYFPMQGMNASMIGLNATTVGVQRDDTATSRCAWWQKALYS